MGNADMTVESRFLERLRGLGVCEQTRVVLAVSGGVDSMVLLRLFNQLPRSIRPIITVAHLNHGLRGLESDADEELVEAVCRELQVACVRRQVEGRDLRQAHRQTLEEAAREVRYWWLRDVAKHHNCQMVMTGHHGDDQIETLVHHLSRGTGLRGLQGMRVVRSLGKGVDLARPLLGHSRSELELWARWHQVKFREDSTNSNSEFTRNRIRQRLESVDGLDPLSGVPELLLRLSQSACEVVQLMDRVSGQIESECVVNRTNDHVLLRRGRLSVVPRLLVSHYFTALWIQQQWPRQKMTSRHWNALVTCVLGQGSSRFQLPGRIDATRQGEYLRLVRVAE